MIVSRHHDWRGPASYAPEDRNVVVCIECGVRCTIGKWKSVPKCRPKVERPSSGYRGWTLNRYLAAHRSNPERHPLPGNLITRGGR